MFSTNTAKLGLMNASDIAEDNETIALLFLYASEDPTTSGEAIARLTAWARSIYILPTGSAFRTDEDGRICLRIDDRFEDLEGFPEKIENLLRMIRDIAQYNLPVKRTVRGTVEYPNEPLITMSLTTSETGHSTLYLEKRQNGKIINCEIFAQLTFKGMWRLFTEVSVFNINEYLR